MSGRACAGVAPGVSRRVYHDHAIVSQRDGHRDGHHRDGYRDAKRSRRDEPPPAPAPPARTPEDEAAFQLKTLVLRIGDFQFKVGEVLKELLGGGSSGGDS